jgi:ferredoxin
MHRVHFRKENVTIDVPAGSNLLAVCRDAGVDPYPLFNGLASCHRSGRCGTCAVEIVLDEDGDEALGPAGKKEKSFFKRLRLFQRKGDELANRLRLACQAEVTGPMTVVTNPNQNEGWKTHGHYSGRPMRSWERT